LGDGVYSDGPQFHWDYYNSFVIQPMLLDTLRNISRYSSRWDAFLPQALARAKRYAAIEERLISPRAPSQPSAAPSPIAAECFTCWPKSPGWASCRRH